MKKSYEERAIKFANYLAKLFQDCVYRKDFEWVIQHYNDTHSRKLHWAYGVSRIAIIRSDYVIKFNFQPEGEWEDGTAGDCYSEEKVYQMAVKDGMEYLLAKTTIHKKYGHTFSIMPRINGVEDYNRCWYKTCTEEEKLWIATHIYDLHPGNVGYYKRKVCIIDYAWSKNI